ncbi:MAG: phosphonate metabolism transcriptional regulator PhnF [Geminicoccaceae bacterium]|nr:phosphonate metabolism transcriptional regulator PhnF [Geminicoccaceae bacterium]
MGLATVERIAGAALWPRIAERLRREIAERYEPNDLLPAEATLAEAFGVNRLTLRRAIDELVAEGLVRREHGRGVRVLGPDLVYAIDRSTRLTLRLEEAGLEGRSTIVAAGTIAAQGGVARRLGLAAGTPVARVETLRFAGELPLCLITHFVAMPEGARVLEGYRGGSLHGFLAERCGLALERRTSLITARLPEGEDARLLRQPATRPILRVKGVNLCARTGRAIEYSVTRFRGDRIELLVEASPRPTGEAAIAPLTGAVAAPLPPSERDQPGDTSP